MMKVKFMFKGAEVEVEVKCEFTSSKYIVKGSVKRVGAIEKKSIFFLWDCTPKEDGTKRYEKPMLRQNGKPVPSCYRDMETDFVVQALKAYKIERSKHKTIEVSIPEGFEPVGEDMFGADAS